MTKLNLNPMTKSLADAAAREKKLRTKKPGGGIAVKHMTNRKKGK
jgi:hypothetical protein